ncbi:MAG: hypothetical protein WBF69_04170 [Castellaniella sp.]|uniref:hypothetical protein n=1 Tax=Castellaniella sp. TaxID=1955812 RepID=UPI003C787247
MKKFKASLIATGVGAALVLAFSGPAFADGDGGDGGDVVVPHHSHGASNYVRDNDRSAVATDHASATSVRLGDVSLGMYSAETTLNGTVKNNGSDGINGNMGGNGGAGGFGGVGNNGDSHAHAYSKAIGADGGSGGGGGSGGTGGGGGGGGAGGFATGGTGGTGGVGGVGNGGTGGGDANGAVSSKALAWATTGNGARGGSGGSANGGSAGSFVVSNSIANSSFASASGIMNVSQNTGSNALTQQGVTVQGNVSFR